MRLGSWKAPAVSEPVIPDLSALLARSAAMRRQAVEARERCVQVRLGTAAQRARARSWLTGQASSSPA